MIAFQRDGPQVLEKDFFSVVKLLRGQGEDLHLKGTEKEFIIEIFKSKCSKKRGQGVYMFEEPVRKSDMGETLRSSWSSNSRDLSYKRINLRAHY